MKRNEGRIRTSHGGNLPLPADLEAMLATRDGRSGHHRGTPENVPPPKRGSTAERDREDFPGFYESGL